MHKAFLAFAVTWAGVLAAAPAARADVLEVPEGEPTPEIVLPAKGLTMAEVVQNYGEPRTRHSAVGGSSRQHPPITRWDYDGFVVVFEKDRVIDAVIPGAPPKIRHREELQPAEATAPADPSAEATPPP